MPAGSPAQALSPAPRRAAGARIDAAAAVVERQARLMARIIEDLLDMTRVRMGKITLARAPMDLAELVMSIVSAWRDARRLEGHAAVQVDASPAWLVGDRARLEQVVSNLFENALKCTPAGGHIHVSVARDGDAAVLRVADSGRGIEPRALDRIFDAFVQGEPAEAAGERGLGLGLAVVRRITELHGGTISAASKGLGLGAAFTVRFPAIEPPRQSLALEIVNTERVQRPGPKPP
jgi:two-component system, sensor histidine kinase